MMEFLADFRLSVYVKSAGPYLIIIYHHHDNFISKTHCQYLPSLRGIIVGAKEEGNIQFNLRGAEDASSVPFHDLDATFILKWFLPGVDEQSCFFSILCS